MNGKKEDVTLWRLKKEEHAIHNKPKKTPKKIEEIVLSTSSDSSTSEDDSDGSSESSSGDTYKTKRSGRYKKATRTVVTPPPFEMSGTMHLKDFLTIFEDYFKRKHVGDKYDQTQVLSQFLSGDLKKIYDILGGRRLKYKKMKEELLDYYKKQRIGGKSYWRKQMGSAEPENAESLDLFGLRLTELAKLAYPKDAKECAAQLRSAFLKAIPPAIKSKILDVERAQKATTGGKKRHLQFSAIAMIAKDMQEQVTTPKKILWTSETRPEARCWSCSQASGDEPKRDRSKEDVKSPSLPKKEYTKQKCAYCRSPTHHLSECWKAQGKCLICGGGHMMEKCDQYDPNRRRNANKKNGRLNA